MVLMAVETGGRATSVRQLKREQVDLDNDIIQLENTKSGGFYPVPITAKLGLELDRWFGGEREKYSVLPDSEYVFPSQKSAYLKSNGSLYVAIHKAAHDAGIQEVVRERPLTEAEKNSKGVQSGTYKWWKVDIHVLRTTYSDMLQKAGLSDNERCAALDHDNVETTRKYYTRQNTDHIGIIREKLNQR
jgi:integrase